MKFNKSEFSPVQNVNYFGVVFDEFLSWDAHVNHWCKKLAQTNGILSESSHHVPQKTCNFSIFLLVLLIYFIRLLSMAIYFKNQSS